MASAEDLLTDEWNRLVQEGLSTEDETNVKLPFKKLTKKYGKAYIAYLRAAWSANLQSEDFSLTLEEFCILNGGVPKTFFEKKVIDHYWVWWAQDGINGVWTCFKCRFMGRPTVKFWTTQGPPEHHPCPNCGKARNGN